MRISTSFLSNLFAASIILGVLMTHPVQGSSKRVRSVTMWWIIFNNPDECTGGYADSGLKCGLSDVMGAASSTENNAMISIFHATGGVSNKKGYLRLTATLYRTSTPLDLTSDADNHYLWGGPQSLYSGNKAFGYSPVGDKDAEVHVVFHDHGPPAEDKEDLLKQLTRFNDPLCGQNDGQNTCVDVGVAAFPIMSNDGTISAAISGFPMFPDGCVETGDCTEMERAVQLSAYDNYDDNSAFLIRSGGGDSIQVVADIRLPKVRKGLM
jgi:hypothetical protein